MDDFSWGSTRLVVGEKGKKIVIHDEGKFDPKSIPLKSWNDYENELWDQESNHSYGSGYPQKSEYLDNNSYAPSMYGQSVRESQYGHSVRESQYAGPGSVQAGSLYAGFEQPRNRGLSPVGSYSDVRSARGGGGSFYDAPVRGTFYDTTQRGDTGAGDSVSMHSFYGQPALQHTNSNFGHAARSDEYLGDNGITDAQLEASIRKICDGADLDTLTKKGVRKQLEQEYGVNLTSRKDVINNLIESVLAGGFRALR